MNQLLFVDTIVDQPSAREIRAKCRQEAKEIAGLRKAMKRHERWIEESDLVIKDRVRERDGYRCRDCGMTNDEHYDAYGKCLDVHRVLKDFCYDDAVCITLCRRCHGKKRGKEYDDGVLSFMNFYNKTHREVLWALIDLANATGTSIHHIEADALNEYLARRDFPSADYCI